MRSLEVVLSQYAPVGFIAVDASADAQNDDARVLTLTEVSAKINEKAAELEVAQGRLAQARKAQKRAAYVADFERYLADPHGEAPVSEGKWTGFRYADARAWACNFLYFNPPADGAAHKVMHYYQVLEELREGKLPEVFGYAEKAHELVRRGVTPRQYRELCETIAV